MFGNFSCSCSSSSFFHSFLYTFEFTLRLGRRRETERERKTLLMDIIMPFHIHTNMRYYIQSFLHLRCTYYFIHEKKSKFIQKYSTMWRAVETWNALLQIRTFTSSTISKIFSLIFYAIIQSCRL